MSSLYSQVTRQLFSVTPYVADFRDDVMTSWENAKLRETRQIGKKKMSEEAGRASCESLKGKKKSGQCEKVVSRWWLTDSPFLQREDTALANSYKDRKWPYCIGTVDNVNETRHQWALMDRDVTECTERKISFQFLRELVSEFHTFSCFCFYLIYFKHNSVHIWISFKAKLHLQP